MLHSPARQIFRDHNQLVSSCQQARTIAVSTEDGSFGTLGSGYCTAVDHPLHNQHCRCHCSSLPALPESRVNPVPTQRQRLPNTGSGTNSGSGRPIPATRSWRCSSGQPGFEPRPVTRGSRGTPPSLSRDRWMHRLQRPEQHPGLDWASKMCWSWSKKIKSFLVLIIILFKRWTFKR